MVAWKYVCLMFVLLVSFQGRGQLARFDLVITEIMADPSPQVGLPNAEYVEIRNRSGSAVNLQGWKLTDGSSTGTVSSSVILEADSSIVFCANGQVAGLSVFGRTIGLTGFPSLNNDEDLLMLKSPDGLLIHVVAYSSSWHDNNVKKDGGWSLEMVDITNPCGGRENWRSSTDIKGGTPGKTNSVAAPLPDTSPPGLIRTWTIDSVHIVLLFSESLDSLHAAATTHYSMDNNAVLEAIPQGPLFQTVELRLAAAMQPSIVYRVNAEHLKDCSGNEMPLQQSAKAGLSQMAKSGDVVINEILFNPHPSGYDYVELFNGSLKIIDATSLFLANRDGAGNIGSQKKIREAPFYIFPGEYVVITENIEDISKRYFVKNPSQLIELSSMPSYPDKNGTVVVTNISGDVVDEVSYSDDWHFALIRDPSGVSLERIDPVGSSREKANWHSASTTAGFGTPTYQNSQFGQIAAGNAMISASPPVFSPDNDGYDDVVTITYSFSEPGYVVNVVVFDVRGRQVRQLIRNALAGKEGAWRWDGLDENRQALPAGLYIIFLEAFNLQGKKQIAKLPVVLAGRR